MKKASILLALAMLAVPSLSHADPFSGSGGFSNAQPSVAGILKASKGSTGGDTGLLTPFVGSIGLGYGTLAGINAESESVAIGNHALGSMRGVQGYYQQDSYAKIGNGYHNVAVGAGAMYYATASGCTADTAAGGFNIAVGAYSLLYNTCGKFNVVVGDHSGQGVNTGYQNTLLGTHNGRNLSSGDNNVFVGYGAGDNVTTGDGNIYIGPSVTPSSATASNQLILGSGTNIAMAATSINTSTPTITFPGAVSTLSVAVNGNTVSATSGSRSINLDRMAHNLPVRSGYKYTVPFARNVVGSLVGTQDRMFACPVYLQANAPVTGGGFRVTTAGIGSTAKLALYAADGTGGFPSTRLAVQNTTQNTTSVNTDYEYTFDSPVSLAAGWYWVAVAHHWTTTAPTVVTWNSLNPYIGVVGSATGSGATGGGDGCVYASMTWASGMPDPFGSATVMTVGTGGPAIYWVSVQ